MGPPLVRDETAVESLGQRLAVAALPGDGPIGSPSLCDGLMKGTLLKRFSPLSSTDL